MANLSTGYDEAAIDVETATQGSRIYRFVGKRIFDLAVAAIMLPIVAPLMLVLWLMVRRDGGPGFYAQPRVGRNGREFRCWKLRTMVVDAEKVLADLCASDPTVAAEWNRDQKLANDPRITPVGDFLRKTSLDEVPQFWNVLIGDMSFVGPRPFMSSQDRLYREAGGRAYYWMRPGLTGPWQVEGRGATSFVERIRFDEKYFRNTSMSTDLKLMLRTARVVLDKTGG